MTVSAKDVQTLRAQTGAGIMDCKKALAEVNGNVERAVDYLRKKGLSAAAKKSGRVAAEGAVGSYIHGGGRIGVMVEVNCETDFVGRNPDFQAFVRDLSMHIAAAAPRVIGREELPAADIAREREILMARVAAEKIPADRVENTVAKRLDKFLAEICLLDQPYVRDPSKTIATVLAELTAKIGEKVVIRRFTRFQLGEGIERRSEDFAAEVAKAAAG